MSSGSLGEPLVAPDVQSKAFPVASLVKVAYSLSVHLVIKDVSLSYTSVVVVSVEGTSRLLSHSPPAQALKENRPAMSP